MEFDVLLPTIIFFIVTISVFLYQKFKKNIPSLLGDRELKPRDAVLMVVLTGIIVTAIAFVPSQAIQIVFLVAYSYMMFSFTFVSLKRWYLAILPPIAFLLLYSLYWELLIFNLFVVVFAVIIPVFLGALFTWKTTAIYAGLLTIMDVIQVIGTGYMGTAATKMVDLKLPVLLLVRTYPANEWIGLGLGDLFLAGLLAIQTSSTRGRIAGLLTAGAIGVATFLFEVALFSTEFAEFFPATVVVMAGWGAGLGISYLFELSQLSFKNAEEKSSPSEHPYGNEELTE